jgi:hypothetical protein
MSIEAQSPCAEVPRAVRRVGRLVALLALVVYLGTTGGSMATDIMSYEVTKGIVERGTVAMSYNVFQMDAHRGVDGRYYAPYGIGHAVYSLPFYAVARLAERATGPSLGKPEVLTKAGFVVGSAFAAALTVWVTFLFAWRLSGDAAAAALTSSAVGFGSLVWPYSKFGFNAPLGTLCVLAGTYGVWSGTRCRRDMWIVLGGAGLGGALLVKHELALVCIPIGLWIIAESVPDRRLIVKRGLLSAMPVLVALGITLYYNEVRFGNPLDTGYLRDDTLGTGSFPAGLAGLLLSPGRSVLLYTPVIAGGVLALWRGRRRDRSTAWLFAGEFVVMLCFYASLVNWDAERSYGPRYLLPVIPLLILPVAWPVRRSGAMLALVVVSAMWQLPGVLVDFSKVGASRVIGQRTEHERQWRWDAAGLVINTKASLRALPDNARRLVSGERPAVKAGESRTRDFSDQFAFSLDFWWVYLYYLRAFSAPTTLVCGAAWLAAIGVVAFRLRRTLTAARGPGS